MTSVYVHFPWCLKKCPYCDFASAAVRRGEVPDEGYADAVIAELDARAETLSGRRLASVFFGGGTPSLWAPSALGRVLDAIRAMFDADREPLEVTVECNPTSLDAAKAAALREVGVDRLSIGVQSLDAERLRYLGRLHDPDGALRAIRAAVAEVPRASADLMFGMPGQQADDFARELDALLEVGVEHVSAYALTIEPDTQFGALHRKGRLPIAPDADFAKTFERARALFAARGFSHYEVSNYARPGQESVHNQHYWRGGDYLALGAGAVGCLAEGASARRYRNDPRPEAYLERPREAEIFTETLTPSDRVAEAIMLGLRTREGVDLDAVRARTGLDLRAGREAAIARRGAQGDLDDEGSRLVIPDDRWLHLDSIIADLF